MSESLCKIRIKIKDYYPKLKNIPYNEYDCIISFNEDQFTIPLKDIENTIFENEPKAIDSDLVYNLTLIIHENNNLISSSVLIIPYIRFVQVVKMKKIQYEQQIKLLLGEQMKEKIFGPGISVGSIFIKFMIEINGAKGLNSIIEFNKKNNNIIKNNSKKRFKSQRDFNLNEYLNNLSNKKNRNNKNNFQMLQSDRNSRKYIIKRTKESKDSMITSISKDYTNKDKYITTQTSPFAIRNHFKQQSVQKYNNNKSKKNVSNCFSPQSNLKKIFSNEMYDKTNINLKKFSSRFIKKVNITKNDMTNRDILSKCFSDISVNEKQIIKAPKTQKRNNRNIFSQDFNKNSISITEGIKKKKSEKNFKRNKSIDNNKSATIKKIVKKTSYKINQKYYIKNNHIKKESPKRNYAFNNSIPKIDEKEFLKYKTSKNFFKNKKFQDKSLIEENKNKSLQKLNIIYENKIKDIKFIKNIKNQEDLKNNMISIIDFCKKKDIETNQSYINKINTFDSKYLLYKEKIVLENKQQYSLQNQNNTKDFKNFIHVKVNSKYNNIILNKMSKIKKKDLNIIKIILNNKNNINNPKKIIEQKLKQQKQMHILLYLIRDLIKIYGNLSHLYDDDNNKKILIKSLFFRYNIKEKEWRNNDNLVDIFNKMINEIKNKKNKEKLKDKFKKEEFKVIKEEEENENDEEEEEEQKENSIKEKKIVEENNEGNIEDNDEEKIEKKGENNEIKEEGKNEINEKENKDKQEKQIITKEEEKMKENINNENINNNIIENNKKENKIFEIKENLIKNVNNNNIINLDKNLNTNNVKNINNDLLNSKNIIINNFIINK